MSQIVKPVPWAPICRALVAPEWQPFWDGLYFAWPLLGYGLNVKDVSGNGRHGAIVGTPIASTTSLGPAFETEASADEYAYVDLGALGTNKYPFTFLYSGVIGSPITASKGLFSWGDTEHDTAPWFLLYTVSTTAVRVYGGAGSPGTMGDHTVAVGDRVVVIIRHWHANIGVGTSTYWFNTAGSKTDKTIFAGTPPVDPNFYLGTGYNNEPPAKHELAVMWDKWLPDAMIHALLRDPLGPFRMDRRVLVAVLSGAQQVNLTAASATWTAASIAVGLGAISVNLSSGSATWAAPSVGVSLGLQVDLSAASATWAAAAVGVQLGAVSVNLSSAPATWAAGSVSVGLGGISVAVSSASATWTAPAVGVQFGGISVSLTSASATWTAVAVTPDTGIQVSLSAASATWTAAAVGIQLGGVSVSLTAASATWSATALASVLTVPAVVVLTNFAIAVAELSNVTIAIGTLANVDVAIPELASVTLEEW